MRACLCGLLPLACRMRGVERYQSEIVFRQAVPQYRERPRPSTGRPSDLNGYEAPPFRWTGKNRYNDPTRHGEEQEQASATKALPRVQSRGRSAVRATKQRIEQRL